MALSDICPHRRFPLSKSKLIGDTIECGYHGFTYASSGKCIKLPAAGTVPANYMVRAFPVVQRWQWIWIWMGDAALADPAKIPDMGMLKLEAAGWEAAPVGVKTLQARYMLLHENLLDLSHLSFLHGATIGSAGVAVTPIEIDEKLGDLQITRRIQNDSGLASQPLGRVLGIEGPVDRLMVQQFFAPGLHATGSVFTGSAGAGAKAGHEYGAFRVLHAITPETPNGTHYFQAFSRNYGLGDAAVRDRMAGSIAEAVAEDIYGSEQIEQMIGPEARASEDIHSRADTGALRGRMIIETLIEAEREVGGAAGGRRALEAAPAA